MKTISSKPLAAALIIALAGCSPNGDQADENVMGNNVMGEAADGAFAGSNGFTDVTPDPDNAALPLTEREPEGAQKVLEAAIRLAETERFDEMKLLWRESEQSTARIAAIAKGAMEHPDAKAVILGPGTSEGAAGTIYMTFPIAIRFPGPDGAEVERKGSVTLRRVNDVPGANEAQLSWRISDAMLDPPAGN